MAPHNKPAAIRKPKNFGASVSFVWSYLKRRKAMLFLAAVMVVVNIGASLAGTAMLQPIIDNFLQPVEQIPVAARFAGLLKGVLTLLCIYLAGVCAGYLQIRLMLSATQRSINDLRRELFDHLQDLSVRYYDTHTHGEMMSRFSNDVDTLNDALANSLTSLFSSVITLAGILFLMLRQSWVLTLLTLAMTPVMFLAAGSLMKRSSKYFVAQQANLGKVNGYVEEIITGQKVVKVFCHEQDAIAEFDEYNEALRQTATTALTYSGLMMPVMMNISTINYALVAMIGGLLSIFGYLSVGGLVVFLQLTRQFSRPITEASSQYNAVITAIAGAERIYEVMLEPAEEPDPLRWCRRSMTFSGSSMAKTENHPDGCPLPGMCGSRRSPLGMPPKSRFSNRSPSMQNPARRSRLWDQPVRAKPPSSICSPGSMTSTRAGLRSMESTSATSEKTACAKQCRSCCRTPTCLPALYGKTSVMAVFLPPMRRSNRQPALQVHIRSSPACPKATIP